MNNYVYVKICIMSKFNKVSSSVVCNFSFNQVGNGQWVALYSHGKFMYNLWSRKDTIVWVNIS